MNGEKDAPDRRAPPWHLKREINISLIVAVLGQFALGVWYISDFNAWRRETDHLLGRHDQSIVDIIAKNQDLSRELADRLARIETKIDNLMQTHH